LNPRGHFIGDGDHIVLVAEAAWQVRTITTWATHEFVYREPKTVSSRTEDEALIDNETWDNPSLIQLEANKYDEPDYSYENFDFDHGILMHDNIPQAAFNFKMQVFRSSVLVPHVNPDIDNHIIVLGWSPNVVDFLMVMRSRRLRKHQPVVIVTPVRPPDQQLQTLGFFPNVNIVVSDLDKCFQKVALPKADNIVILSESKAAPVDVLSSKSREGSDDYHALMLTMKVLSLDFHINSIVALHDQQNSRFLPASIKVRSNPATVKSSKCRRRATEMVGAFTPASVIGQAFTESLPDRLLSNLFYTSCAVDVAQGLLGRPDFRCHIGDACAQLFLMAIPRAFWDKQKFTSPTYTRLFLFLLETCGHIPMGLLRNSDLIRRTAPLGTSAQTLGGSALYADQCGSRIPYVALAPLPLAEVRETDMVYVLAHEAPQTQEATGAEEAKEVSIDHIDASPPRARRRSCLRLETAKAPPDGHVVPLGGPVINSGRADDAGPGIEVTPASFLLDEHRIEEHCGDLDGPMDR
jgi:hypothetical protein